jgi:endoglucanase
MSRVDRPAPRFASNERNVEVTSIPRRRRRRAILAGTVAAALAAVGVVAVQANAEAAGELVINGTFDAGQDPWFVTVPGGVTDGQLCANVPPGTTNPWDAIVGQNNIVIAEGVTYTLKFTASATKDVVVRALVGESDPPFGTQTDQHPNLTTTPQEFSYIFEANATWTNGQVAFQIGGSADAWTFCVDNVSLAPFAAEQLINGDFSAGKDPWWATGNVPADVVDGKLCAEVPGGTTNPWDAIVGQNDITILSGESYTFSFEAAASKNITVRALVGLNGPPFTTATDQNPQLTPTPQTFTYTFTANEDWDGTGQVAFQLGGSADAWTFCLDNVSLAGGAAPPVYTPDTGPRVRVNQVGYLPKGPKNATVVTEASEPLAWQLLDGSDAVVASGTTTPRGVDDSSGQNVHSIDFSAHRDAGTGFRLVADGETSHPFDLSAAAYEQLRIDSLKFYYTQRSGIEILDSLRPGYGRPAGHVGAAPNQGDVSVLCQPGVCDYSLDVRGGWYDAGDHGKYVVNGGISVYQLMSEFERTKVAASAEAATLGDSTLALPESGNGVPDILDEARWEMEFLLSMQVPAGKPLAGMAHHKIHDEQWTGLPLMPHLDPQKRELHAPSTAATLNLAATAAQSARLFASYDRAFADRSLAAARAAWAAATANPAVYALPSDATGGGPYDDDNVTDEFYWAAAELFITTGEKEFSDYVLASPLHTSDVFRAESFDWKYTATPARLDLALIPNDLPGRDAVRASVLAGADEYLATIAAHPYGLPYSPANGLFDWGSNNLVLNNMVVMATAFDISGDRRYRDGVLQGMDYLLGRNALNQSYVTGYGENASENQHSRWYAHQLNADLPNPPPGTLSGGPNSSIQDPVAQALLQDCEPQFCYVDEIQSWSTNELTINWNSTLAWVAAFVADQGDATPVAAATCRVRYETAELPFGLFAGAVTITNTGSSTIDGWTLGWSFIGDQRVVLPLGASVTQSGAAVTAKNIALNKRIRPGRAVSFAFLGTSSLADLEPGLFLLNGEACT